MRTLHPFIGCSERREHMASSAWHDDVLTFLLVEKHAVTSTLKSHLWLLYELYMSLTEALPHSGLCLHSSPGEPADWFSCSLPRSCVRQRPLVMGPLGAMTQLSFWPLPSALAAASVGWKRRVKGGTRWCHMPGPGTTDGGWPGHRRAPYPGLIH